jgi:hypothetical protein
MGLSRGGFAIFKVVIGAFMMAISAKPSIAYRRMETPE